MLFLNIFSLSEWKKNQNTKPKPQTTWQKKTPKTQQLKQGFQNKTLQHMSPRNPSKTCGLLSHCQSTRVEPERKVTLWGAQAVAARGGGGDQRDVIATQESPEGLGTRARQCPGARGRDRAGQHGHPRHELRSGRSPSSWEAAVRPRSPALWSPPRAALRTPL